MPSGGRLWSRTGYTIVALAVLNLLFINFFFFGRPITTLTPFHSSKAEQVVPGPSLNEQSLPSSSPNAKSIHLKSSNAQSTPTSGSGKQAISTPSRNDQMASDLKPDKEAVPGPNAPEPFTTSAPSEFTHAVFNLKDYNFDGEYVGWPLQRVCEEAQWTPGLSFVCDNNAGGIGNIRNYILTCIRYAIDAGATRLILPRIQSRSQGNLRKLLTTSFQSFNYFFDEEHFRNSIHTFCPQMKILNTLDNIPNAALNMHIEKFFPKDLNVDLDGCDVRGVNRHLDMYHTKFLEWLNTSRRTPTVEEPVSIRMKWPTFFEWPVYRDGPEFAATFGGILRLRKDVQELAAKVLTEMVRLTGVEPHPPTLNAPFLGVHLRTESDSLHMWPNFKFQSTGYLEQAQKRGLQYAYLACGDEGEANRFSEVALNQTTPLNVATKMSLLKGDNLQQLTDLSWDQQALVDFLVLTKSAHFTGCSFSSFAMNIAFKRHLMVDGIRTRQWKSPGDEFSTLVGRFESWYGDWMFMYECMWA